MEKQVNVEIQEGTGEDIQNSQVRWEDRRRQVRVKKTVR